MNPMHTHQSLKTANENKMKLNIEAKRYKRTADYE
jgi:hypothetical protein